MHRRFSYKKKGYLTRHIAPVVSSDTGASVAEMASEIALTSRPKDTDKDSEAESGSDESSEDEGECGED